MDNNVNEEIKNNNIPEDRDLSEKKVKKKVKLNKKLKIFIISLIVILLTICVIFIIRGRVKEMNTLTIEKYKVYQYFGGRKVEFFGKFSMTRDGDITTMEYDGMDVESDYTPIYFVEENNQMIIPDNMSLIIPRLFNKNYKLPYFTKIFFDESEDGTNAFFIDGDKEIYLDESFLYDGNNLYIFLYETTVTIEGKTYVMSPLSYMEVNYKDAIYYYDKASDKYGIIDTHEKDVLAEFNGYKINLSTDLLINQDESRLLIKNVKDLKTYTGKN